MPTVMRCLDLTLATPAENLACDEALLEAAEAGEGEPTLRFWEPRDTFVVLGYTNPAAREVEEGACQAAGVPVYRRISGGGAVLQGPGCLNYALVLRIEAGGPLARITGTNGFIMQRHAQALSSLTQRPIQVEGFTDLTLDGLKFSGNSQRRRQRFLLFHGSFLLEANLTSIERCLRFPSRQPAYRRNRPHHAFLTNLGLPAQRVKAALQEAWNASSASIEFPERQVARLVREKYSREEWNFKFR